MGQNVILLVDDEPELLSVCFEALEAPERRLLSAGNGLEALKILESGEVDLVVSDLRMPRMGGMDLLRKISELDLGADVLFLTGYGGLENAVECIRLGAVDYLLKPFRLDDLQKAVDKALSERALRKQQNQIGSLVKLLSLSKALASQQDVRSLLREFITQVQGAFEPDGVSMFLQSDFGLDLPPEIHLGPTLKSNPRARQWFAAFGRKLIEHGRPKLLEAELLSRVFESPKPPITSVMAAPVSSGLGAIGVIVVSRGPQNPAYMLKSLQLLTIFASHACHCLECYRACQKLSETNRQIIDSYVSAVEAKDRYTSGHSSRVSLYAQTLGARLGLAGSELEVLRGAGYLHDIGKIGAPDNLLNKPGPLTPEERQIMRQHPEVGANILCCVTSLQDILPVIRHHHENFDGSGYPGALAGQDIPHLSRVLSVVDGFEAMTSDRSYHEARAPDHACRILEQGAGTQWDAEVVAAWLSIVQGPGFGALLESARTTRPRL